jgi:hypothetical protein
LSLDYDRDGDLDVFIVNHGERPILYRNDGGNENDWLRIKLEGTASNRDGMGAFITVDPDSSIVGDEMVREINAGSNFLSHNELTAHFGLGPDAANIDAITVLWPSGAMQALVNISPNQILNLVENAEPLPGDFNSDGFVDAADYVVWRKANGGNMAGYAQWRANFGAIMLAAGGSLGRLTVPEPSTLLLLVIGALAVTKVAPRDHNRLRPASGWHDDINGN